MMPAAPIVAAVALEYATTGDLGRTSEHPTASHPISWSPTVSPEGAAVMARLELVSLALESGNMVVAVPSEVYTIRLATTAPTSWMNFAQALFPDSRTMTRDERRDFDASAWSDLEPIEFVDD